MLCFKIKLNTMKKRDKYGRYTTDNSLKGWFQREKHIGMVWIIAISFLIIMYFIHAYLNYL